MYFFRLERKIKVTKYYCYYCFTTAHQRALHVIKKSSNCDIKANNKCSILVEKFHYFLKTNNDYEKKHNEDCALLVQL